MSIMRLRIMSFRDIQFDTVRACEPHDKLSGTHVSQCECGRFAFRYVGDSRGPWIECVCGERFNSNNQWIGNVVQ